MVRSHPPRSPSILAASAAVALLAGLPVLAARGAEETSNETGWAEHDSCLHGRLERAVVRSRVFREPELRRRLEAALHPLIRAEMERRLTTVTSRYAILAIPLLVESGSRARVDRILVVDCSRETQLARTLARDGSDRATVEGILAAQATRDDRLRVADDVIDNDGPLEALEPQVERLHGLYLQIADDAR